jgi:TRAP-type C4-dicarboxylate transport system permease large subunit
LFNAARIILSGFRGGLAAATLVASASFGAVSGSSVANAATMTRRRREFTLLGGAVA